jgi:N-acetyl sugar amidotransferase
MDTSDPAIEFDENGICNHCRRYEKEFSKRVYSGSVSINKLESLVKDIKKKGKNNEYDCIIGVSGGVDSTYVGYLCKKFGLKPLAVHFDNGWNSELAVRNIEKTLDRLGIDLYTYVINWEDFKQLQISFLKASTPDGEIPTDHAINALLFREAAKRNIGFIINGMNFAAESISIPTWAYGHSDWRYIKSVHKIFNRSSLFNYPKYNFWNLFVWMIIKRIKVVSILNYIDYNKDEAMETLSRELDWVYYGGKHYESIYTRFYQGYILPTKFNIDKRRAHFSDLINSGQLTREIALNKLNEPAYDAKLLKQDFDFVLKKFEMTEDEFKDIMQLPKKNFKDYKNNYVLVQRLKSFLNYLRYIGILSR